MRTSTPDSVPNPAAMRAKSVFGAAATVKKRSTAAVNCPDEPYHRVQGRENTATGIVKDLNTQLGKKLRIRQVQRGTSCWKVRSPHSRVTAGRYHQ